MIYLTGCPDNLYFHWQVIVQMFNFQRNGLLGNYKVVFLVQPDFEPSPFLKLLKEKYPNTVYYYYDERDYKQYIPTIRIHGLWKFLKDYPNDDVFYIDTDVILTEKLDLSDLDDGKVYGSNTYSYLGYEYISTKGQEIYNEMSRTMEIDPTIPKNKTNGTVIGAQVYYKKIKGLSEYYKEVEDYSHSLYQRMINEPSQRKMEVPIQSWTAEMWAYLWLIWKKDIETIAIDRLDFKWATDYSPMDKSILHMAGVTEQLSNIMFFKGNYVDRVPFFDDFSFIDENSLSLLYVNEFKNMLKNKNYAILARSL